MEEEREVNIQEFENECKRIVFHIIQAIENNNDSFCIPYLESFIPDFMRTTNEFISSSYIEKNILSKIVEYLDAIIEPDTSLEDNQVKINYKKCVIIIEYNSWFNRNEFNIEISGKIIRN